MRQRFSVMFFFKRSKNCTKAAVPLYMRVTVGGERADFSLKRSWNPERWNMETYRATGTKEDARTLNAYLDTMQNKVYETQRLLTEQGVEITAEAIREKFGGGERSRRLIEIFEEHNEQMSQLVDIEFAPGTMERYETAKKHVESFLQWKYGITDIDIKRISYQFVTDYEFWLKAIQKCSHNTSLKYISNLKKIINICIKNGWLDRDPFFGYKMKKREVIREFLSEDEIAKVYSYDFPTSRLTVVRDMFIFSCYTGLSYADIQKLKRSEIIVGIDGEKWICTQRQKTETASRIPLLPIALEIIEKYKDDVRCITKDLLLPILSNQKMNSYLKEIAGVVGIEKEFTFHCARHTFATTVTLANGVPIETVSKMLGHTNLKTTQHYAKILDSKVSQDMKLLKTKIARKNRQREKKDKTGT